MRKKFLALLLVLALVVGLCPSVLAASSSYKSWSQGDDPWGSLLMGDAGSDTMKKAGCLITAVAKMLVYSGQQDETFTPGKCLSALKESSMLTSGGAMRSGNYNKTFLPTYAPELRHESSSAHSGSPWKQDKAVSEISSKLNNSYYVIVCVKNTATGNTHWMLVDRVENNDVYVMDNGGVVPLYGTKKYSGGVIDQSYFKYSGTDNKPPVSDTTVVDNGPVISPTTEPGLDLPQGKPFYFKGKITSVSKVTSATISILSPDGKTTYQTKTIKPNTLTVDIATSGLDALKFGQLSPGSYLFHLTATNQSGKTSSWQKGFSIAGAAPATPAPAPQEKPSIVEAGIGSYDVNLLENIYPYIQYRSSSPATVTMTAKANGTPVAASEITVTENSSSYYSCKFPAKVEGTYTVQLTVTNAGGSVSTPAYTIRSSLKSSSQQPEPSQPQEPESTGYTLTINYYIDDKLVFTDQCPSANSESAYIYEFPAAYRDYEFRGVYTNPNIGLFRTELWVGTLGQNETIDLYTTSSGDAPEQSVSPQEPTTYIVNIVYKDEAGEMLDVERVQVNAGAEFIHTFESKKADYEVVTGYSQNYDCGVHKTLYQLKVSEVDHDGTIYVILRPIERQPETTVSPQPTTAPDSTSVGSSSNFKTVNAYYSGLFDDVAATDWFDENVERAYELGLMKGTSGSAFSPKSSVTLAETVALAARLHSIYYTGTESFVQSGKNWYDVYMTYASANGIPTRPSSYLGPTDIISRKNFVAILSKALPAEALPAIVDDVYFDDVSGDTASIYLLARAGVVRGVPNAFGSLDFQPDYGITRAEVAAIVTRMADPALRK